MLHVARQYVDVTGLQDKLKRHELNILFELHVNLEQLKYYILHPRQPIAKIRVQLIVIMQSKLARSDKCLHQIVRKSKNYKKGRWNKKYTTCWNIQFQFRWMNADRYAMFRWFHLDHVRVYASFTYIHTIFARNPTFCSLTICQKNSIVVRPTFELDS